MPSAKAKSLAHNLAATVNGTAKKPFRFSTLGQLATIGRRTGVANILGINFSGFIAWWLWRTIYLMKLPRLEKKVRVALDWTLDLFFTKDIVRHHAASLTRSPSQQWQISPSYNFGGVDADSDQASNLIGDSSSASTLVRG